MKRILAAIIALFVSITISTDYVVLASGLPSNSASASGLLTDIKCSKDGGNEVIAVYLSSYSSYNVMRLTGPDRLVFDFNNVRLSNIPQSIAAGGSLVKTVRSGQFTETTARVVLDAAGQTQYKVEQKPGVFYIYVPGSNIGQQDGSDAVNNDNPSRGGIDREIKSVYRDLSIAYSERSGKDEVAISMGSSKKYNAMRLTGPDRLVVDIPGMKAPANQKTINVNSKLISTIRYAKLGSNTARVVLDINSQMQYNVLEKNGKLVLEVENPTYRNITYCNNGDRVFFTLKGARLTEGGQDLKTLYTGKYAENGLKYTMTFSGNLADLGSGTIKINDGLVDSVDIVKDPNTGLTSITFSSKEKLTYLAITRPEAGDTTITVLKPASAKEKLVVIDAGHGGFEPGAVYGSLKEKDLNLDIAIRLNTLLEKKKIKTYMLRENDSYVGLYERTHIANNLNASLFLSIHNNAIGDPGFGGTMTLYYPQMSNSTAFNGRRFAQIIQTKLLSKLGTTDRRIIERPNLVVLKATTMPAALAEVAFVTNTKDRNALQTAAFKQNAAQALCDGIVQALKEIK